MSFDQEPDAPLHGECAEEIRKLHERVRGLTEALDEIVKKHKDDCEHIHNGWKALSKFGADRPLGGG